jgi:hypothetical protein
MAEKLPYVKVLLGLTKNDDEGGFELKNLNHVLHDEVVQVTLDERLWIFLKVLYTDKAWPQSPKHHDARSRGSQIIPESRVT